MLNTLTLAVATGASSAPEPLFGNQWLALAAILAGVAVLIGLVALLGRVLAATHPDDASVRKVAERAAAAGGASGSAGAAIAALSAPESLGGIAPEILAAISAAVVTVLGRNASIVNVHPVKQEPVSVEMLMQQWSIEGRRQVYSSHQFR